VTEHAYIYNTYYMTILAIEWWLLLLNNMWPHSLCHRSHRFWIRIVSIPWSYIRAYEPSVIDYLKSAWSIMGHSMKRKISPGMKRKISPDSRQRAKNRWCHCPLPTQSASGRATEASYHSPSPGACWGEEGGGWGAGTVAGVGKGIHGGGDDALMP
jgi:hypothetical protein